MPVNASQLALTTELRQLVVDTMALYIQAHAAHWNVEGSDFPQLHELFGDIYEDIHGSIDPLAEYLRTHKVEAPCQLETFASEQSLKTPDAGEESEFGGYTGRRLVKALLTSIVAYLADVQAMYKLANAGGDLGLANYLQDRMTALRKWQWQLTSTLVLD